MGQAMCNILHNHSEVNFAFGKQSLFPFSIYVTYIYIYIFHFFFTMFVPSWVVKYGY